VGEKSSATAAANRAYLARPKKMIRTIRRKKYHTQITKGSTTEGNSAFIRETMDEALPLLAGSRIGVHLGRLFLSGDFGKDARDKVEPVLDGGEHCKVRSVGRASLRCLYYLLVADE
jgi:hypothetical protein